MGRLILVGFACLAPLSASAAPCDDGDGQACLDLGEKHARGDDVPRDHPLAAKYFRKACQARLMPGCTRLGFMFQKGFGVRESADAAVKLYTQACDGGDPDACALLATMYMHGEGVEADPKKAAELMERAGAKPQREPRPQTAEQQLQVMEQSCSRGEGRACLFLGHHYAFDSKGKLKDPTRGLRYFLSGCDRGSAVACTSAGLLHSNGLGTERDEKRAAELYTRACSANEGDGCHHLAELFEGGGEVERDIAKAFALHDKACGAEISRSCLSAGVMRVLGEGTSVDAAAAAASFSAGCRLEDMYACALLGVHFEHGVGTTKDPKQAKRSYERAWRFGQKRLSEKPDDRNLLCDHAELAINLRRSHGEVRGLVERCVKTSTEPYELVVAHVLAATADTLAGRDPAKAVKGALTALPGASEKRLSWSFKTLRVAMIGRPHRAVLLPLFAALDETSPAEREAKVAPLLQELQKAKKAKKK